MSTPVLRTGCLAYLDTLSGLVPVKVLSVTKPSTPPAFDLTYGQAKASIKVCCEVTEDKPPYKKGEIISEFSSLHVVPRAAIRKSNFHLVIGIYDVVCD